jgi:hypothetical protein
MLTLLEEIKDVFESKRAVIFGLCFRYEERESSNCACDSNEKHDSSMGRKNFSMLGKFGNDTMEKFGNKNGETDVICF